MLGATATITLAIRNSSCCHRKTYQMNKIEQKDTKEREEA